MKTCPYCKKEILPSLHIYKCAKEHNIIKDRIDIKYDYILHNFPSLTKEFFVKKYEIELYSLPMFNAEFGTDNKTVSFLIDYYKIHKRNIKESSNLISQEKYRKTCNEKYGVDNVSKVDAVQKKKENTFILHYGVNNIFKDKEFKDYITENNFAWLYDESNKSRAISQSKSIRYFWENVSDERKYEIHEYNKLQYQKWWNNLSQEEKTAVIQKRQAYVSKIETRVAKILRDNNITYTAQFWINRKSYDFRFDKTKILLEVQGDFWHANPSKYCANDVLKHPGSWVTAQQLWEKDKMKNDIALSYGYKVLYLWESEINKLTDVELYDAIIKKLKNETKVN
ncbi:MAG: very short patch repair endonuclease [Clostridia bacterium]|jgi:G:T-mismatch repair DNA endonuclease (very short patch repair protein)|nr:very short patch repair endonuclease [Clostridia bacterium]